MERRAWSRLAEEPCDEAPDERADDAKRARHDEAELSGDRHYVKFAARDNSGHLQWGAGARYGRDC